MAFGVFGYSVERVRNVVISDPNEEKDSKFFSELISWDSCEGPSGKASLTPS